MTTIVTALNRIARECSVKAPSSWLTATRDDHLEIRDDFLLETIEDILDRVDLPSPTGKQQTITGDGSTNYALNTDFYRLARDGAAVYDSQQDRPCIPVTSDGEWTYLNDIGAAGAVKYYRIKGYDGAFTIDFYNAPTSSETFTVSYVSDLWMASSGGTAGSAFTAADDVLLWPRRVVEAGTVMRFRQRRGLDYTAKMIEYEAQIARLANDGRTRRVINFGDRARDVRWQDLVPSWIPDS